jgi:hypothetical protein
MIEIQDYKHRGFRFTGRSGRYGVDYPFTVSGELWLSERETSAMAARAIMALNPGMDIQDDSENGGVYLNVKTEADARRLIDSLIEQGRVEDIDPEVYARERGDALIKLSFMPDATNENVRQVIRDEQARVEAMRRFLMEYPS